MCEHIQSVLASQLKTRKVQSRLRFACSVCNYWTPPTVLCVDCSGDHGLLCGDHWLQHEHAVAYSFRTQQLACSRCCKQYPKPIRGLVKCGPGLWKGEVGLKNLGNTCYMNSALQCFFRCPGIWEYFLDVGCYYVDETRAFPLFQHTYELAKALANSDIVIVPKAFVVAVFNAFPFLEPGRQQDSQEFLRLFIDYLDKALGGTSFISTVFRGVLKQYRHCLGCKHVTEVEEPFFELQVPINEEAADSGVDLLEETEQTFYNLSVARHRSFLARCLGHSNGNVRTVYDCINHFFSPTVADGKLQCDVCEQNCQFRLRYVLEQPPNVLVLVFKRFAFVQGRSRKIKTHVQLLKTLKSEHLGNYELTGVVEHRGSMHSGHYRAYVNRLESWVRYDDKRVSYVSEATVLGVQAYIAFYSKSREASHMPKAAAMVPREWMIALRRLSEPRTLQYGRLACRHNRQHPLAKSGLFEAVEDFEDAPELNFEYEECKKCAGELAQEVMTLRDEAKLVDADNALSPDDLGYLVSVTWFDKWKQYLSWTENCLSSPTLPGKVTNSSLVHEGRLKPDATQNTDYVVVTPFAWRVFKERHQFDYELEKTDTSVLITAAE